MRLLRTALLAAMVALAPACSDPNLAPLEMPAAGIRLRSDFAAGRAYAGHVRVESVRPSGERDTLELDVRLVSDGPHPDKGGAVVRIAFDAVEVAWGGVDPAATSAAIAALQPAVVLDANGTITAVEVATPSDPSHALVAAAAIDGALRAFLAVSPRPIRRGDFWKAAPRPGTTGDVEASVDGLFRMVDRGDEVVQLEIRQRGTATDAGASVEMDERGEVLFATAGHVARVKITARRGTVERTISADFFSPPRGG
jgi:hypothetical protein